MSESLRNDGRVWVPKEAGRHPAAERDPRGRARLLPRAEVSELRQSGAARRRLPQRQAGLRRGPRRRRERPCGLSRFRGRHRATRQSRSIREKYGNLFHMYQKITDEDPYTVPMRIYPAIHYTMGGLWVDYNLMSTIPGLHVLGEANFSDHGANRLGASALMQGLADGYFIIPYTIGHYLASTSAAQGRDRSRRVQGSRDRGAEAAQPAPLGQGQPQSVREIPPGARTNPVGRRRHGAERGELDATRSTPGSTRSGRVLAAACRCLAAPTTSTRASSTPGRVADYLEFAELLALDALERRESCGGHFREESQTPRQRGAARRRPLLVRGRVGVQGRGQAAGAAQGAARLRGGPSRRSGRYK